MDEFKHSSNCIEFFETDQEKLDKQAVIDKDLLISNLVQQNTQLKLQTEQISSNITQSNEDLISKISDLQKTLNISIPIENPTTLDDYKKNKILEINTACNQTILGGFNSSCTGIEHQYKFDMEYQNNINQIGIMINLDSTIENIDFPTKDAGIISHTKLQFIQLCKDAQTFKETNIYRYFTMKAQIEICETINSINGFIW